MSIWCSGRTIGHELDWEPDPDDEPTGEVRSYCDGWSNHYPTTDGEAEQPASLDVSHIPSWCVPGHRWDGDGEEPEWYFGAIGPWCRLIVESWKHDFMNTPAVKGRERASVVMDEAAVRSLVADLTAWLEQPKVYPIANGGES